MRASLGKHTVMKTDHELYHVSNQRHAKVRGLSIKLRSKTSSERLIKKSLKMTPKLYITTMRYIIIYNTIIILL